MQRVARVCQRQLILVITYKLPAKFTDHFGGPGTAIGPVCLCVSVCSGNNFRAKRPLTWTFSMLVPLGAVWVKFEGHGHNSEVTVTGEKCPKSVTSSGGFSVTLLTSFKSL